MKMMKKFNFNIVFEKYAKSCDFGGSVLAINEDDAKASAREWAKMNGFNGSVKTCEVSEVKNENVHI